MLPLGLSSFVSNGAVAGAPPSLSEGEFWAVLLLSRGAAAAGPVAVARSHSAPPPPPQPPRFSPSPVCLGGEGGHWYLRGRCKTGLERVALVPAASRGRGSASSSQVCRG